MTPDVVHLTFPKMDQFVSKPVGENNISSMDGLLGYNQASMSKEDNKKKLSRIQGVLLYIVKFCSD